MNDTGPETIFELKAIGVIRTPFEDKKEIPCQGYRSQAVGEVEVFPEYEEALRDIEGFSHVYLIYYFHENTGYEPLIRPFLDEREHGAFATRYYNRPNPIGISVVRLTGVEGNALEVSQVDMLDGTPLLDIKPYVPRFDHREDVRIGWLEGRTDKRQSELHGPARSKGTGDSAPERMEAMVEEKGNVFHGVLGGAVYDRVAPLLGFGMPLYRKAAACVPVLAGMRALDLGCGTAAFSLAIAERIGADARIDVVDLSEKQLARAKAKAEGMEARFEFHRCSMDELPFKPATFDLVVSSMAFHEVPPEVRRGAIREAARVLKRGGTFVLVDWSKPRFGLAALPWLPFLLFDQAGDNWKNVYPGLFREQGLLQEHDEYLNSLVRCQLFRLDG